MDARLNIFEEAKKPLHIQIPNAELLIKDGLVTSVGKEYSWHESYFEIVKWLVDNERKSLLIVGSNGTGKTLMASRILPNIIRYYYNIVPYVTSAIDLSRIADDRIDYMKMRASKVMVIEDFGTESISSIYGEKRDLFSEFVDIAERESKLMILTTNISGDELKKKYGMRTYDRLRPYKHVIINGKSNR
jgi:DNA replication protein DnaC